MTVENHPPNRFIIGLTGNIGTGKSTVTKMLQHLGAYGIDADILTQKVYAHTRAQEQIIARFGGVIMNSRNTIDRNKLAGIVFNDPSALADLEEIIHPYVSTAARQLIRQAKLPIIVIEAIKLLESDLVDMCDSIWVVDAPEETVLDRLINQRGMNAKQVKERLSNQSSAAKKKEAANNVIDNSNSYQKTWDQVIDTYYELCRNNKEFAFLAAETLEQLDAISTYFLVPFSSVYDQIESELRISDKKPVTKMLPTDEIINSQKLAKYTSRQFIHASENLFVDDYLYIFDLSTFTLKCSGTFRVDKRVITRRPSPNYGVLDTFANYHHVERIILPIHTLLKEEEQLLMEREYMRLNSTSQNSTHWFKAGYNLFYKQYWDANALFRNGA